jgi:hypothetical protein
MSDKKSEGLYIEVKILVHSLYDYEHAVEKKVDVRIGSSMSRIMANPISLAAGLLYQEAVDEFEKKEKDALP